MQQPPLWCEVCGEFGETRCAGWTWEDGSPGTRAGYWVGHCPQLECGAKARYLAYCGAKDKAPVGATLVRADD